MTFPEGKVCQPCIAFCDICTNKEKCEVCDYSHLKYKEICFESCPESTYQKWPNCIDCPHSNCSRCNELEPLKCKKCKAGSLFNNTCWEVCPDKFISVLLECKACTSMINHCLTCFNEQNVTCTKCEEGYDLKSAKECSSNVSKGFLIGLIIAGSLVFIGAGVFIGLKLFFKKKTRAKTTAKDSLLDDDPSNTMAT